MNGLAVELEEEVGVLVLQLPLNMKMEKVWLLV